MFKIMGKSRHVQFVGNEENLKAINTVNGEILVSTKFRISNFRIQIFSDMSQPFKI